MEIIDNFLSEELFNQLQSTIISDCFPIYFQDVVTDDDKTSDLDNIVFTHGIYKDYSPCSEFFPIVYNTLIISLKKRFDDRIKSLLRCKVNCYPRSKRVCRHNFHDDYSFTHKGALLSLNTCNGWTEFGDGSKVESVANRLLLFDPSLPHASTSCSDQRCRWNIQLNYLSAIEW